MATHPLPWSQCTCRLETETHRDRSRCCCHVVSARYRDGAHRCFLGTVRREVRLSSRIIRIGSGNQMSPAAGCWRLIGASRYSPHTHHHHRNDVSNSTSHTSLKRVSVLNIKYSSLLACAPDSDLCAIRAVGINLATRMATVWCRSKVEVNRFLGNPPPTTREYTCPFPYEIVEMIIAHLTDDLTTLKACSLTSRSWYIVAVQHLHHTLTLKEDVPSSTGDKTNPRSIHDKLRPLSELHDLGLMPLVGEIRVDHGYSMDSWFVPKVFSRRDLWYFSTFTNVHTLRLQNFEIDQFIPGIKHFFGNFSPTLRSITLHRLRCDPQHLSHFLSLFSNLDNIELMYTIMSHGEGAEPIPSSTPTRKLRGRLAIYGSYQPEAWSHLIASCGGLQFHHIDLRKGASCAFVLLEACAKTLETLRFDAEAALDSKQFPIIHHGFKLMVNRKSQPIGTQGPPISTSGSLGIRLPQIKPPSYHGRGCIFNDQIPRVLRTRCSPRAPRDLFTLGDHVV